MTISIKIQYKNELRRLAFANESDLSYNELANRVERLFGLSGRQFRVRYKDEEGDYVTVDTQEELQVALSIAQDSERKILRLEVDLLPSEANGQALAEHLEELFTALCESIGIDKERAEAFVRTIVPDRIKNLVSCQQKDLGVARQILEAFLAGNLQGLPFFPRSQQGFNEAEQGFAAPFNCGRRGRWRRWFNGGGPGCHPCPNDNQGGGAFAQHEFPNPHHPPPPCGFPGPPPPSFGGSVPPPPPGGRPWFPAPSPFDVAGTAKEAEETTESGQGPPHCGAPHMGGVHGPFFGNAPFWMGRCRGRNPGFGGEKPKARFVADLTIFDGTVFRPTATFTKIWRMRNTGEKKWPEGSQLEHVSGPSLGAISKAPVIIADPGSEVDISIDMEAPAKEGRYVSVWRLVDPYGRRFGQKVWVEIHVSTSDGLPSESSEEGARDRGDESGEDEEENKENEARNEGNFNVRDNGFSEESQRVAQDLFRSFGIDSSAASGVINSLPPELKNIANVFLPRMGDLMSQTNGSQSEVSAFDSVNAAAEHDHKVDSGNLSKESKPDGGEEAVGPAESEDSFEHVDENQTREEDQVDRFTSARGTEEKLAQLQSMGFRDVELNQKVLAEFEGSIDSAIVFLRNLRNYADKLAQLESMGFTNTFVCAKLLIECAGNLDDVLSKLCP